MVAIKGATSEAKCGSINTYLGMVLDIITNGLGKTSEKAAWTQLWISFGLSSLEVINTAVSSRPRPCSAIFSTLTNLSREWHIQRYQKAFMPHCNRFTILEKKEKEEVKISPLPSFQTEKLSNMSLFIKSCECYVKQHRLPCAIPVPPFIHTSRIGTKMPACVFNSFKKEDLVCCHLQRRLSLMISKAVWDTNYSTLTHTHTHTQVCPNPKTSELHIYVNSEVICCWFWEGLWELWASAAEWQWPCVIVHRCYASLCHCLATLLINSILLFFFLHFCFAGENVHLIQMC